MVLKHETLRGSCIDLKVATDHDHKISDEIKNVTAAAPACADFPQAAAGLRAADGEGGGHDLRQLEGAHHVQHQTAQVNADVSDGVNFKGAKKTKRLKRTGFFKCVSLSPPAGP